MFERFMDAPKFENTRFKTFFQKTFTDTFTHEKLLYSFIVKPRL